MTPPRRVLVVEDDPLSLELMTDLLEGAGWVVHAATSGEAALEHLDRESIDLVLLDLGLPGMDGHTSMRAIRERQPNSSIPVIAVTAQAMSGDAERAIRAGFDGYLTKPIDTRRLVATIDAIVEVRRPTERTD